MSEKPTRTPTHELMTLQIDHYAELEDIQRLCALAHVMSRFLTRAQILRVFDECEDD